MHIRLYSLALGVTIKRLGVFSDYSYDPESGSDDSEAFELFDSGSIDEAKAYSKRQRRRSRKFSLFKKKSSESEGICDEETPPLVRLTWKSF